MLFSFLKEPSRKIKSAKAREERSKVSIET